MFFSFLKRHQSGFTLIEVLVVVAISGMLMLSLGNVVGQVSNTRSEIENSNELEREAAFAMRRLVQVLSRGSSLDLKKNTATNIHIHILSDPQRDANKDGFADADNDKDGRVDEDDTGDMNGDGEPGIKDEDDDGDGSIDEGHTNDDDEDGEKDEDKPDEIHLQWENGLFEERDVVPFDVDGDGDVDNHDKLDHILLTDKITSFTLDYTTTGRYPLCEVTLVFTDSTGKQMTLASKIRIGGRL